MARRALHELDEIAVQMRDYASGLRGFIRVHANISAITQFLPQDIRLFLNECPNVQVDLEEKISSAIIKSVAENAADVGIISGRRRTTTWRFILTVKTRWRWWCRTAIPCCGNRVSFCRCAGLRLRWTAPGSAINRILSNAASDEKRNIRLKVQVTGFDALCFMVNSGWESAYCPGYRPPLFRHVRRPHHGVDRTVGAAPDPDLRPFV